MCAFCEAFYRELCFNRLIPSPSQEEVNMNNINIHLCLCNCIGVTDYSGIRIVVGDTLLHPRTKYIQSANAGNKTIISDDVPDDYILTYLNSTLKELDSIATDLAEGQFDQHEEFFWDIHGSAVDYVLKVKNKEILSIRCRKNQDGESRDLTVPELNSEYPIERKQFCKECSHIFAEFSEGVETVWKENGVLQQLQESKPTPEHFRLRSQEIAEALSSSD